MCRKFQVACTRPLLQNFIRAEDLEWNYQLYMNDIEINRLDFFRGRSTWTITSTWRA